MPERGAPGCIIIARAWAVHLGCRSRTDLVCPPLSFPQCSVRVKTDPKLMNNPEAQCTAFYLDFFKCADACVRPKHYCSARPPARGDRTRILAPCAATGPSVSCRLFLVPALSPSFLARWMDGSLCCAVCLCWHRAPTSSSRCSSRGRESGALRWFEDGPVVVRLSPCVGLGHPGHRRKRGAEALCLSREYCGFTGRARCAAASADQAAVGGAAGSCCC